MFGIKFDWDQVVKISPVSIKLSIDFGIYVFCADWKWNDKT